MLTSLIGFLLIGLAAGYLAGRIMKGGQGGLAGDLIVGVVGSFVGGFLIRLIGFSASGLIAELLTATFGAVVLIAVLRAVQKQR